MRVVRSGLVIALAMGAACSGDDTRMVAEVRSVVPVPACEAEDAVRADIDGDGLEDRAYHRWATSTAEARVGVCTAAGIRDEIDGAGQAEGVFEAFDLEPDGRFELAFGATTVNQRLTSLAVFVAGRLEVVSLPAAGDPLVLAEGPVDDTTAQAWGCEPSPGSEARRLVQVRIRHHGADAEWTRTSYSLEGAVARPAGVEAKSGPAHQTPERHAAALVPPC